MPEPREFTLAGPDDFVRLDRRCAELLREFFAWLQTPEGGEHPPEVAGRFAHDGDRYLRDFVVDFQETGPADADPTLPRQYLGNWYIVHTLTPTHEEMERIALALGRLYRFLAEQGIVPDDTASAVREAVADREFFRQRLQTFWDLAPDAIPSWRSVDDYRRRRAPS